MDKKLQGGSMVNIRNEAAADYKKVEEFTRRAFYNLYVPGCFEHYLVHIMRGHKDFITELDFIIEEDSRVIGNIMYTKARLIDEEGNEKNILTFGPFCIDPEYQRKGYGRKLINYSFEKAAALGYDVIVIFGDPRNYTKYGFKSCKRYNVTVGEGLFPAAMMVKELKEGVLDGRRWFYHQSPLYELDLQAAEKYDESLEKMEKKVLPCQEEFYILSQAFLSGE